ncbi:unnamed protein product, partial [Mesocestoides corti]
MDEEVRIGTMPSKLLDFSLYKEIAFFPSFGQSTIYNLCDLPSQCSVTNGEDPSCRKHDLMAASLLPAVESSSSNRCCTHYSFSSDGEKLTMTSKSFDFVYLPTADIVCLDAFYDDHAKHYVVCVGLVKEDGTSFFNIYAAATLSELPERCVCLSELDYFPLQATHVNYISPTNRTPQCALLLSCSGGLPPPHDLNQCCVGPIQVYTRLLDVNSS